MSILSILDALASDGSRLAKEKILKDNINNEELKLVFQKALDGLTQFWIRKIPVYEPSNTPMPLSYALDKLVTLENRDVTGNAAIVYLTNLLSNLSKDDAEVLSRIIQKDLKCGVSTSTVNKIWPDLIYEYKIMLAEPFNQKYIDKIEWPAIAQVKMDGARFNAIVKEDGSDVQYYSRNGKEINIHNVLDTYFKALVSEQPVSIGGYVFDGELLVKDDDGNILPREVGNGIINKAIRGTLSIIEAQNIFAVLWDVVPLNEFKKGRSDATYEQRFGWLCSVIMNATQFAMSNKLHFDIVPVQSFWVADQGAAQQLYETLLSEGQEGIILKEKSSPWENKRSQHHIKFKAENDADLRCVGTVAGEGKYAGMIGALILETRDGVRTNCGSGLSDEQRKLPPEYWIGKLISIHYNSKIKDKTTGKDSFFLPIFIGERLDKSEADLYSELKDK